MLCPVPSDRQTIEHALTQHKLDRVNSKVTTVALTAVAISCFSVACLLWGFGTSPGTMLSGTQFLPYVAGTFFGSVSIGVVAGSALFALKWALHSVQISRHEEALQGA